MSSRPKAKSSAQQVASGAVDADGLVTTSGSARMPAPLEKRHLGKASTRQAKPSRPLSAKESVVTKSPMKRSLPSKADVIAQPKALKKRHGRRHSGSSRNGNKGGHSAFDYLPSLTSVPFIVSVHFAALGGFLYFVVFA